jgi:hypothetical protein
MWWVGSLNRPSLPDGFGVAADTAFGRNAYRVFDFIDA